MPVYLCYRGDCNHLALQAGQPVFTAMDALGRTWLCLETGLAGIPPGFPDTVWEMLEVQGLAHNKRLSHEGTQQSWFDCRNEADLRRKLVLNTYPSADASQSRLTEAG
jgi:hypothetical protein